MVRIVQKLAGRFISVRGKPAEAVPGVARDGTHAVIDIIIIVIC